MARKKFINTKPSERKWNAQAGGWSVPNIKCPKDGAGVVYNGNYFCSNFNTEACDWALEHPARTEADKAICDALGISRG